MALPRLLNEENVELIGELKPLISVVMPCHNSSAFIIEAILSVLNQTYRNLELIVVDDHSSDRSASIIAELANLDPRIRPVYKDVNVGAAESRNVALDMAQGEYIAFLDSDDSWRKDKLQVQLAHMSKYGSLFSYSYYDETSESGECRNTLKAPKIATRNKLLFTCFISCSSVVIARALLGKTRQRNLVCRNDYMFWLDLLKSGAIATCCPSVLSTYRRGSGISSNKVRNLRMYFYVVSQSSSSGILWLAVTTPIYLFFNVIKKFFPVTYNKIIVNL